MKKTTLFLFVILSSISFLQMDCKDEPPVIPPTTNPLQLTVEDATCTEVFIKLSLNTSEANRTVTLKRGDSSNATITMAGSDSLFVDEGLLPKKTYTYTLAHDNWSVSAQATTQDTTSHNVQWQLPDTLGAQGLIRDVWVFSKTDAWAVGEIYLKDNTGKIDNANPYNAAHWNGSTWELKKITVNFRGNLITPPLEGIFAFSPTQIWFAGSLPIFGDGSTWTIYDLRTTLNPNISVSKVWGSNFQNMYFVGSGGNIVHYNGSSWIKMESNTTVDLQDIWGIDDTHIWATGTTVSDGHSVVLQCNGTQWQTIYENTNKPANEFFGFMTLWTDTPSRIYLDGSGLHIMKLKNFNIGPQLNTGRVYASVRLRANGRNDIFNVGPVEVAHYNGYSWFRYSEPGILFNDAARFSNVFPARDFILIGGYYYTGLNGIPVVVRGYR